jgi:hypothetical protein
MTPFLTKLAGWLLAIPCVAGPGVAAMQSLMHELAVTHPQETPAEAVESADVEERPATTGTSTDSPNNSDDAEIEKRIAVLHERGDVDMAKDATIVLKQFHSLRLGNYNVVSDVPEIHMIGLYEAANAHAAKTPAGRADDLDHQESCGCSTATMPAESVARDWQRFLSAQSAKDALKDI